MALRLIGNNLVSSNSNNNNDKKQIDYRQPFSSNRRQSLLSRITGDRTEKPAATQLNIKNSGLVSVIIARIITIRGGKKNLITSPPQPRQVVEKERNNNKKKTKRKKPAAFWKDQGQLLDGVPALLLTATLKGLTSHDVFLQCSQINVRLVKRRSTVRMFMH